MSWIARKISGSDNEDVRLIQEEYFKIKANEQKLREEEIKKFWQEYEDEYFNG